MIFLPALVVGRLFDMGYHRVPLLPGAYTAILASSGSIFDASGFLGDEFAGCIPRGKEVSSAYLS
jgi:hypothetical protein